MKTIFLLAAYYVFYVTGGSSIFQKKKEDYSINHTLFIMDDSSIIKSVGDLHKFRVETYSDGEVVYMLNKDGSECLKLITQPGGFRNTYGEFEVSYNKVKRKLYYKSNFQSFLTESGIKLGMTDSALISIKGNPGNRIRQPDGAVLYEYSFANDALYCFRAWLKNGTVQKFRFGLENP